MESVQFDLTRGEESVWCWGGDTKRKRSRGGENSTSEKSSKVTVKKILLVVGGVMGVDEWRLGPGVVIVFIIVLLNLSSLCIHILVVGRGLSTAGNVISSKNSKSIDSSRVFDSISFAIISNVAVLTNPLVVSATFLSVHNTIFLGKCRPKLSGSGIESLLLQNSSIARISCELRSSKRGACENGN